MVEFITTFKKENDFNEMTIPEKRKKDRKFGRFIKKSLDELNDFKSKY